MVTCISFFQHYRTYIIPDIHISRLPISTGYITFSLKHDQVSVLYLRLQLH